VVSLKIAVGIAKPEKIIQCQLNVDDCPHISEKNECRIYAKRPLMCRAFPYESGTVSVKCPVIGSRIGANEQCEVEVSTTEGEASEKLNMHLLNRFQRLSKKGQKLWEFDLKTRRWATRKIGAGHSSMFHVKLPLESCTGSFDSNHFVCGSTERPYVALNPRSSSGT
jgi:hypothetical protein